MPLDEALLGQLTDTVDIDGKQVPLREAQFVKEAPDFQTLIKNSYNAHREVGARIPIKIDTTKPEEVKKWRETHIPALRNAGLLPKPPSSHTEYNVKKPTDLPEGLTWNDDRADRFAKVLHKYEVPPEMAGELMELNKEALMSNVNFVKTTMAEGISALKTEYGDKYDPMVEDAKRLTGKIFKTPDELAFFTATGIANHPSFLSVMMRLAQVAKGDSSFLPDAKKGGTGTMTGEEVKAELSKIMNDKTHPDHAGYIRGEKVVMDKIDVLYQKAYGTEKVTF